MADSQGDIAFDVTNETGQGGVLLVCEHASNFVPARYGNLGLTAELASAHIAWDPGAGAVSDALSALLDAPILKGAMSRLIYDCNRPPEAPDAVPARSEIYDIPGNAGLSDAERARRAELVYHPFHTRLATLIVAQPAPPVLVTIHSFTPVYRGARRAVEIGILHDSDARLADAMLAASDRHTTALVARNEPYGPRDGVTHTLKRHAIPRGLLNVMIEIRNDLLTTPEACTAMAATLAGWLREAVDTVKEETGAVTQ